MPTLLIYIGETLDREVVLGDQPLQLGRADGNDIVLADPDKSVSRQHATITCDGGTCRITDRDSQNGIWLAGRRVAVADLTTGAPVLVGQYRLLLKQEQPPASVTEATMVGPAAADPGATVYISREKAAALTAKAAPTPTAAEPSPVPPVAPAPAPAPAAPPAPASAPVKAAAPPAPAPAPPPVAAPKAKADAPPAAAPKPAEPKAVEPKAAETKATATTGASDAPRGGSKLPLVGIAAAVVVIGVGAGAYLALVGLPGSSQPAETTQASAPPVDPVTPPVDAAPPAAPSEPEVAPEPEPPPPQEVTPPPPATPAPATPAPKVAPLQAAPVSPRPAPAARAPQATKRPSQPAPVREVPFNAASAFEAARSAMIAGDYTTAIAGFETILQKDPNYANAAQLLEVARGGARNAAQLAVDAGNKAEMNGEYDAARVQYEKALALDAQSQSATSAMQRLQTRMTREGEAAFRAARQFDALGQGPSAIGKYEQALRLLPAEHESAKVARERLAVLKGGL